MTFSVYLCSRKRQEAKSMHITPYYKYTRTRKTLLLCLLVLMLKPAQLQAKHTTPPNDTTSSAPLLFTQEEPSPKREIRAVWVTTLFGLDWPKTRAISETSREAQKQELCQLLDRLKAININTILFQTRVRGSVIYPSEIEPWDGALTGVIGRDPGYDPLQFAIEETHRRGMEFHAWVVTIPCFKVAVAKQMGSKSVLNTHPDLCRKHGDTYYLDPGLPGTADYLQRICHEIASRYDIDGLHFDYIRYPENASSFDDASTYRKYASKATTKTEWRRNNITHIVRSIYEDIHKLKPWVRISSSPVGKYADVSRYSSRGWNARDAVFQDAQEWLRRGIHDILFPMMYFDGNHFYPFAADWQEQRSGRLVAPGLGVYFLHPKEKDWPLGTIIRQLYYLRNQGLSGQAYFRSNFLTDNTKGLYDYLPRDFYAFPALPPACTWLDSISPRQPEDLHLVTSASGISKLAWAAPKDAAKTEKAGLRYNIYASDQWPVDTEKAENLVATCLTDNHFTINLLHAVRSHLYFAVTALDRCGNESAPAQLSTSPEHIPSTKLHLDRNGHVLDLVKRPLPPSSPQGKKKSKSFNKK